MAARCPPAHGEGHPGADDDELNDRWPPPCGSLPGGDGAPSPQNGLDEIFKVIDRANKYIDETAPWTLAKDPANRARLATVLYNLLEATRICAVLLTPFIPDSCDKLFDQIGACECCRTWEKANVGRLPETDATVVQRGRPCSPVSTPRRRWHSSSHPGGSAARPRCPPSRWSPS